MRAVPVSARPLYIPKIMAGNGLVIRIGGRPGDSRWTWTVKPAELRACKHGDRAKVRDLEKQLRTLPYGDTMDPGYRRLKYSRYADDHILGFIGPKAEAEEIKAKLATFLRETLGLELSAAKTLISHARTQPARYLGYNIIVQHANTKITSGLRSVNGTIALRVPPDVVKAQSARYRQHGKPVAPVPAPEPVRLRHRQDLRG